MKKLFITIIVFVMFFVFVTNFSFSFDSDYIDIIDITDLDQDYNSNSFRTVKSYNDNLYMIGEGYRKIVRAKGVVPSKERMIEISKNKDGVWYIDRNDNSFGFARTNYIDTNQCRKINDKQLKLIQSYPAAKIQKWDTQYVIGQKSSLSAWGKDSCWVNNGELYIMTNKPGKEYSYYTGPEYDIDFLLDNYQKAIDHIKGLPYKQYKDPGQQKWAIWNFYVNNLTYDKKLLLEYKAGDDYATPKNSPYFLENVYLDQKGVCGSLNYVFGLAVNYLGLDNIGSVIVQWDTNDELYTHAILYSKWSDEYYDIASEITYRNGKYFGLSHRDLLKKIDKIPLNSK